MALIKCPECGREVSDKATACPNCGYALNKSNGNIAPKSNKKWIVATVVAVLAIAVGIGAWLLFANDSKPMSEADAVTETKSSVTNTPAEETKNLDIAIFIRTKSIEWCGINQETPVLVSESTDIVSELKQFGFDVVNQETKTFYGEGEEPYQATITNLKKGGEDGFEIETNGHDVTITFKNATQADSFIDNAVEMGFKKASEYDGSTNYCWSLKDDYGNESIQDNVGDIYISRKGNQVSIFTAQP